MILYKSHFHTIANNLLYKVVYQVSFIFYIMLPACWLTLATLSLYYLGTRQIYINDTTWSYMWQRPSVTVYTWMWNYSLTESTEALSLITIEVEFHSRKLSHKKLVDLFPWGQIERVFQSTAWNISFSLLEWSSVSHGSD